MSYGTTIDVDLVVEDLEGEHRGDSRGSHNDVNEARKRVVFSESVEFTSLEISDTNVEHSAWSNDNLRS